MFCKAPMPSARTFFLIVPASIKWEVTALMHAGCVGLFLVTHPDLNAQFAGNNLQTED